MANPVASDMYSVLEHGGPTEFEGDPAKALQKSLFDLAKQLSDLVHDQFHLLPAATGNLRPTFTDELRTFPR